MPETVQLYADLAGSQRDTLWAVYHYDRSTPRTIAGVLPSSYQTIYNAIDRLEDESLVETEAHPTDGRQRVVTCTERGKQVLADRQKWERGGPEVADA
ncbi:MarR family winged helix-turn-helix transcriptional regulator [Halobaculum sp. EA56]|uniref:MarR family winged helix-turn-helix transcriptional regulator n=1 Tax=Halobaculum sp. EA56 TaxID=3421648 RepID=UPI003EBB5F45